MQNIIDEIHKIIFYKYNFLTIFKVFVKGSDFVYLMFLELKKTLQNCKAYNIK